MSFAELSEPDLLILEGLRHDRLRECLGTELVGCLLQTTLDNELLIYCDRHDALAPLLDKSSLLTHLAYQITGAATLRLYHAGKELFATPTREVQIETGAIALTALEFEAAVEMYFEEEAMATATLERQTTKQPPRQAAATTGAPLPGCSLADIAADVEQPLDVVQAWFATNGVPIILYKEAAIVTGENAIAAYDHFEPLLLEQRRARRGMMTVAPAATNGRRAATTVKREEMGEKGETAAQEKAERKPAAKKATAAKPAAKTTAKKTTRPAAKRTGT